MNGYSGYVKWEPKPHEPLFHEHPLIDYITGEMAMLKWSTMEYMKRMIREPHYKILDRIEFRRSWE